MTLPLHFVFLLPFVLVFAVTCGLSCLQYFSDQDGVIHLPEEEEEARGRGKKKTTRRRRKKRSLFENSPLTFLIILGSTLLVSLVVLFISIYFTFSPAA